MVYRKRHRSCRVKRQELNSRLKTLIAVQPQESYLNFISYLLIYKMNNKTCCRGVLDM